MVKSIVSWIQTEVNRNVQKGANTMKKRNQSLRHDATACRMPYIAGISATERRQYWPGSPWNAFRAALR